MSVAPRQIVLHVSRPPNALSRARCVAVISPLTETGQPRVTRQDQVRRFVQSFPAFSRRAWVPDTLRGTTARFPFEQAWQCQERGRREATETMEQKEDTNQHSQTPKKNKNEHPVEGAERNLNNFETPSDERATTHQHIKVKKQKRKTRHKIT